MITIGATFAPCPLCTVHGRRADCTACSGTGRIAQATQHGEEPTA